jgi:hypothetical protein
VVIAFVRSSEPIVVTEKRKRRWCQFSLRTLLLAVLMLSLPLSWLATKLEQARRQRKAIAMVTALDGVALYDYEYDVYFAEETGPYAFETVEPVSPWPYWMRRLMGDDFLHSVVLVCIPITDETQLTDDDIELLRALPRLRAIRLSYESASEPTLEGLKGLDSIEQLSLADSRVSDAALVHLETLTNLEHLDLRGTRVSPEGLKKLREALPQCEIRY